MSNELTLATLGAGCFWCTEAVFQRIPGVHKVTSGYTGGKTENPTYDDICTGKTQHAEVAKLIFDSRVISYEELLDHFWQMHDPTTLNRQGADTGTQYRSAIFTHSNEQLEQARQSKEKWDRSGHFNSPIVTEITPAEHFYPAEGYHQNYFDTNPQVGYCQFVIQPKIEKIDRLLKSNKC
ncbi:MAG: peptide-methionine (S)-S-oxide reductase MsrA [Verrucomicrobiota bacterium]